MDMRGELQAQLIRCTELLEAYLEIGPAGAFGFSHINEAVENGKKALESGSDAAMRIALESLREKE